MIQSTIANICWDIVLLELLLGSRDQQTYLTNKKKMFLHKFLKNRKVNNVVLDSKAPLNYY